MTTTPRMLRPVPTDAGVSPGVLARLFAAFRENLFGRPDHVGHELEAICPEAIDISAEAIRDLHVVMNGHAADLCGNRNPDFFRRQLRNERAITGEDVGRLAVQAPEHVCAWLRPFLKAAARRAPAAFVRMLADVAPLAGFHLAPTAAPTTNALQAAAGVSGGAGALVDRLLRDMADGRMDDKAGHLERIRVVEQALAAMKASVSVPEAPVRRADIPKGESDAS